jgi:5-hydroxyisourate hydrolase
MGHLTTHVLDTATGQPACGMAWSLYQIKPDHTKIASGETNREGRNDNPIIEGIDFKIGIYELIFMAGNYFRSIGVDLPEPPFLDEINLRFGIANPNEQYHVPLLISPYGYSTYRGS